MLENWAKLAGFAAVLSAALSVSFLWALYYVPPQNTEWTCEAKPSANAPNKPALETFTCHTKQPQNLENQATRANKQSDQETTGGIKITDVFLALFNGLLVMVTAILIAVGIGQGRELKRAVDASKDEFNATHRPRIRVKHLWLTEDIWGKEQITVSLGIVNNGTAVATLNTMGIRFAIVRTGRAIPFEPDIPNIPGVNVAGVKMPVGVWWTYPNIKNGVQLTDAENTAIQNGDSKLYCIGYVSYYDGARNMRITGFCRVLESPPKYLFGKDNSRFRRFDDPDYEYED